MGFCDTPGVGEGCGVALITVGDRRGPLGTGPGGHGAVGSGCRPRLYHDMIKTAKIMKKFVILSAE